MGKIKTGERNRRRGMEGRIRPYIPKYQTTDLQYAARRKKESQRSHRSGFLFFCSRYSFNLHDTHNSLYEASLSAHLRPDIRARSVRCLHNHLPRPIFSKEPYLLPMQRLLSPGDPAASDSKRSGSIHQIAHDKASVIDMCRSVLIS